MKKFRQIDCLSMAYGLAFMAVIVLASAKCWTTLTMMAAVMVCLWLAIIQRGMKGGENG